MPIIKFILFIIFILFIRRAYLIYRLIKKAQFKVYTHHQNNNSFQGVFGQSGFEYKSKEQRVNRGKEVPIEAEYKVINEKDLKTGDRT